MLQFLALVSAVHFDHEIKIFEALLATHRIQMV